MKEQIKCDNQLLLDNPRCASYSYDASDTILGNVKTMFGCEVTMDNDKGYDNFLRCHGFSESDFNNNL